MIIKRNLKNYKRILDGYQEDTNFGKPDDSDHISKRIM